jgi:uridine kinase
MKLKKTRKQYGGQILVGPLKKSAKRTRMEPLIIHISGASGSGKTTLGNKLKQQFGNKIIVKDLDDLRAEFESHSGFSSFSSKFDSELYQAFLDKYILSQKKPLVLVGLNHMFWHNKKLYYNVHSQYNYYIDIDDMLIVKQKCIRFLTDELKDMVTKNESIIRDITEDNEKFVRLTKENIERECGTKETLKINNMWKKDYEKQGYKFMARENIYKSVVKILNNKFSK